MIEPKNYYDPNLPPPEKVVIPLADFQELCAAVSALLDAHVFIRNVMPILRFEDMEQIDMGKRIDMLVEIDHFERHMLA